MEVVTMVGGAVLNPLVQSLIDNLRSTDLLTYAHESKVLIELNKWETMLKAIFAVLDSAEEKQTTNKSVKSWFNDLRNLAYDVEDILDEFNTEARWRKFRAASKDSSSKLKKLIPSFVEGMSFRSSKFNEGIISKMRNISHRFEVIMVQKDLFKLSESGAGGKKRVKEERTTLPTTSLIDEAKVYGREKDRKAILQLMKAEAGPGGISVIPVVGMGGVGKTTLAKLIYNDDSNQLDFKAWVHIGEYFDVFTITKTILRVRSDDGVEDLESLQLQLKEKLSGKKFLVILDDVWNEDYEKWTLFYGPFSAGNPGSRIIVTTRNQGVSSMTGTVDGYSLQELSYNDCLFVFVQHALGAKDFNGHMHLEEVGKKIVEKCGGLPLAAKALGGVLRGKQDISSWEEVLNSKIWGERSIVLPALMLSYYHLPPNLKRCFGYSAIFRKACEFDKLELVLLWMAEGFVQQLDTGNEYFDELLARSLFQPSSNHTSLFVMHDLINDLARYVSGNLCFNLDEETKAKKLYPEVRHSAFDCSDYDNASRFEMFHEMTHLRTFLALQFIPAEKYCYLSSMVLEDIIPKFECLRVLVLPYYGIIDLPSSICFLKLLRHLNLSYAKIIVLQETLAKLFNLQTLILFHCRNLLQLPNNLCKLINLQCLDIRETISLKEMPLHIGKLTKLHTLSKFIVGNVRGRQLAELMKISNLRGELHVTRLENVMNVQDAENAKIREKQGLEGLVLEWSDDHKGERNELQILTALQPPERTARLSIKSYKGTTFPSWLVDHSLKSVTTLELCDCWEVLSLPPLGQLPSLKDLSISGMHRVQEIGMEFYGEVSSSTFIVFPSLVTLKIARMTGWKRWRWFKDERGQVFPKLQRLALIDCPALIQDLPKHLIALQQIEICYCPNLKVVLGILPSLQELVIRRCKEVVLSNVIDLKSFTKWEIEGISDPKSSEDSIRADEKRMNFAFYDVIARRNAAITIQAAYRHYHQVKSLAKKNN